MLYNSDYLYTAEQTLRTQPLYQYERFSSQPSPILNCFLNRRRCEEKSQKGQQSNKLNLIKAKYNPDGRHGLITVDGGSIFAFSTYDVGFSYTYYLRMFNGYASSIFFPDKTNRSIIGWSDGQIRFYPDLLKINKNDDTVFKLKFNDGKINKVVQFDNGDLGVVTGDKFYIVDGGNSQNYSQLQGIYGSNQNNLQLAQTQQEIYQNIQGMFWGQEQIQDNLQPQQSLFETETKIKDVCIIDNNVFLGAGDKLAIYDKRVGSKPVAYTFYNINSSSSTFSQIDLNVNKQLVAAAGAQEASIFDIRNLDPNINCTLFKVQPMNVNEDKRKNNIEDGQKVMWHPIYNNWLVTSNKHSIINFYSTDYTNQSVPFENIDMTENDIDQQIESICHFNDYEFNNKYLISQGVIYGAHRGKCETAIENFKESLDFDIHPSGNQLLTIGSDQELKVFTSQRFGNLGKDCFNGGKYELLQGDSKHSQGQKQYNTWTFNQPQYKEQQIKDALEILKKCQNGDVEPMNDYTSTAQERYILEEEKEFRK